MGPRCARHEQGHGLGQVGKVFFGGQAAEVADYQGIFGQVYLATKFWAVAGGKKGYVHTGGNFRDRPVDAAPADQVGDAAARRDHLTAEIGVHGREPYHETDQRFRLQRHVVRVLLVKGVVGKDQRQASLSRHSNGGIAQQKRVMAVHDIRDERFYFLIDIKRQGNPHRKVAAVEMLDRRDSHDFAAGSASARHVRNRWAPLRERGAPF